MSKAGRAICPQECTKHQGPLHRAHDNYFVIMVHVSNRFLFFGGHVLLSSTLLQLAQIERQKKGGEGL